MIKGFFIVLSIIVIPGVALGQGQQTLEDTLREVSKDLASLHQEVQDAYRAQTDPSLRFPFAALDYRILITSNDSAIRAGADDRTFVLNKPSRGTSFKVVDKVGDWYAVTLDRPTKGQTTGWVKAAMVAPEVIKLAPTGMAVDPGKQETVSDRIYEQITKSVTAIREKYKNNSYLRVTGFTVNVALPPSVTVSFEFK